MKDNLVFLEDAADFIKQVIVRLDNISENGFLNDADLQDSVTLKIIYIGEALNRVSDDFQAQYSDLPWAKAIGMRHRLAHDYGAVDPNQVWRVVKHDLPELQRIIQTILSKSAA
jgi:uncharacterized protein with HEPN domain